MDNYTDTPVFFVEILNYLDSTKDSVGNAHLDRDSYTVRQWLGILGGNASTSIMDSSLYGDIVIELTLSPAGVLMLSPPVGTLVSVSSVTNTEVNVTTAANSTVGAVAAQGIDKYLI